MASIKRGAKIDSLIDYVLNVKPYHTKLSEIVEEYIFSDTANVSMTGEEHQTLAILGSDFNRTGQKTTLKVWNRVSPRPESTLSAEKILLSDGSRRTFAVPVTAVPKLFSQSNKHKFTVGVNDDQQIIGLSYGAYNQRGFEGPGIKRVLRNDVVQAEGVDYHISHGAFTFTTGAASWWATPIEIQQPRNCNAGTTLNYLPYSSDFTNAEWAKTNVTVVNDELERAPISNSGEPRAKINLVSTSRNITTAGGSWTLNGPAWPGFIAVEPLHNVPLTNGIVNEGPELVSNGNFSTGSGWTVVLSSTGISGGQMTITSSGGNAYCAQTINCLAGDKLRISFNLVSRTGSGLAYVRLNGVDVRAPVSQNPGIATYEFISPINNPTLIFQTYASVPNAFVLDDVSVKVLSTAISYRWTNNSNTYHGLYNVISGGFTNPLSFSIYVEKGIGDTAITTAISIYDGTTSAHAAIATLTWATEVATLTAGTGTGSSVSALKIADVGPNGGLVYRLSVTTTGISGNVCRAYIYPTGITSNTNTVILHDAQVKFNNPGFYQWVDSAAVYDRTPAAMKFTETAISGVKAVIESVTVPADAPTTFSVYLKKAEREFAQVQIGNFANQVASNVVVNLTTGAFTATDLSRSWVSDAGNGWWKVSTHTVKNNVTGTLAPSVYICNSLGGSTTYMGDGSGIYVWGAQFEYTSMPSNEYVPTSGAGGARFFSPPSCNFDVTPGSEYYNSTTLISQFGGLEYKEVKRSFGTITSIFASAATPDWEEFTLTWEEVNNALKVVGSISGDLPYAQFNIAYVNAKINFYFDGTAVGVFPDIRDGDQFVLTPSSKITVHSTAPSETWSLIKTNPQALVARPVFTPTTGINADDPGISIYGNSLEWTPASQWSIVFTNENEYVLNAVQSVTPPPGPNVIVNGAFTSAMNGTWFTNGTINISTGACKITAATASYAYIRQVTLTPGKTYQVEFDLIDTNIGSGALVYGPNRLPCTGLGRASFTIVAPLDGNIRIDTNSTTIGAYVTVDNVTATELFPAELVSITNEYPKTVSTINGCTFKDDNIHYTLIPNANGWSANDSFTWEVKEDKAHYLVYGSVSGWQPPATVGKWYWNGKIGFKVPKLDYIALTDTGEPAGFAGLRPVHSTAVPSVYEITMRKPVSFSSNLTPKSATVLHNIDGYKAGLTVGEEWTDEYAKFEINQLNSAIPFAENYKIRVYLTDVFNKIVSGLYDELPYDTTYYEDSVAEILSSANLLKEKIPLFHSHGTVIFPSITAADVGDEIVIDKAEKDRVQLRIGNGDPVSSALATTNGWLPLEFRGFDRLTENSSANDFDLHTRIEAYLGSDPSVRVFTITQPRYKATNRSASARLQFEPAFFNAYLSAGTLYTLRFAQASSFGSTAYVKMTENLDVYNRILNLSFQTQDSVLVGRLSYAGAITSDQSQVSNSGHVGNIESDQTQSSIMSTATKFGTITSDQTQSSSLVDNFKTRIYWTELEISKHLLAYGLAGGSTQAVATSISSGGKRSSIYWTELQITSSTFGSYSMASGSSSAVALSRVDAKAIGLTYGMGVASGVNSDSPVQALNVYWTEFAVGAGNAISSGNASGGSIILGKGKSDFRSVGSAKGIGATTSVTGGGAIGSIAGSSVASGKLTADKRAVGIASGISTSESEGTSYEVNVRWIEFECSLDARAAGFADGSGLASAVGKSTANFLRAGNASGTSSVTAMANTVPPSVGTISGIGSATGTFRAQTRRVGSAAGTSTVSAPSNISGGGVGLAYGTSTATASRILKILGAGSASGTSNVLSRGGQVGSASGVGTATSVGRSQIRRVGAASGIGNVAAIGRIEGRRTGVAAGIGAISGTGRSQVRRAGVANGQGIAIGEPPLQVQARQSSTMQNAVNVGTLSPLVFSSGVAAGSTIFVGVTARSTNGAVVNMNDIVTSMSMTGVTFTRAHTATQYTDQGAEIWIGTVGTAGATNLTLNFVSDSSISASAVEFTSALVLDKSTSKFENAKTSMTIGPLTGLSPTLGVGVAVVFHDSWGVPAIGFNTPASWSQIGVNNNGNGGPAPMWFGFKPTSGSSSESVTITSTNADEYGQTGIFAVYNVTSSTKTATGSATGSSSATAVPTEPPSSKVYWSEFEAPG